MELKAYQARVLSELREFLALTKTARSAGAAYEAFWALHGIIPQKDAAIKPYNDAVAGTPHVCLKVPTAGGKTFIACNALKAIFDEYGFVQKKAVVWLVPTDSILEQTVRTLKDAQHPYRQKINVDFGGRVEVYEKAELLQGRGFSSATVREQLNIFVLSFDSLRSSKKEGRKVYQDNANLLSFADETGADVSAGDEISLVQVIASLHPVVIVDESHNAATPLSVDMLRVLEPSFILDLTATPRESSNIISFVTAQELKSEHMVKLPVIIQNNASVEGVIGNALHLQRILEQKAKECQKRYSSPYIRPLVLFQAQPKSGEEATTFDKLKSLLLKTGCKEEEIAVKTSDRNELKHVVLTSERCKIRYIITVNALKEGWDCPFAYILASVANRSADVDVTQILGRILRQPYVQHHPDENLNTSYVLTNSADFFRTVERIAYTLNQSHFTGKDFRAYDSREQGTGIAAAPVAVQPELQLESSVTPAPERAHTQGSEDLNNADVSLISGIVADETEHILQQAQNAQQQAAQEKMQSPAAKEPIVPPEIQSQLRQNEYAMRPEFKDALHLRIPQFSMAVKLPAQFSFDGAEGSSVQVKFYKESLLQGFALSKQNIQINFTAETTIYEVDATSSSVQQLTFKKISGTELDALQKLIASPKQKKSARIALACDKVMQIIGSKFPIDDRELRAYIERVLTNFTEDEFGKFASDMLRYSACISEKIDALSDEYSEPKFYEGVEAEHIGLGWYYALPETQVVTKPCPAAIPKSLYEREGDMNDFEKSVINEVANLENVVWWHRNIERHGFEINGVVNHYPDFIVLTKSGRVVMIETKGDHLIATKKIKLGNTWAQNAGKQFKYFLVYDKLQVDGSKIKDAFLRLMREL